MITKTKEEITAEIAALRALKPVGMFAGKTEASIVLAVEELEHGVDRTCEEWFELSDEQRDIVEQAYAWKCGQAETKPSSGWEGLCE